MAPKIQIEKLPDGAHAKLGRYDNAGRWYPHPDYQVPGSFEVRSPSRSWPYGYLKHVYTKKYAKLLALYKPLTYIQLQGIDPGSEEGKKIIAAHAARRMQA